MNPAFFVLPTESVGPEKVELCAVFLSGSNGTTNRLKPITPPFILFPLSSICPRIRDPLAFHSKQQIRQWPLKQREGKQILEPDVNHVSGTLCKPQARYAIGVF